MHPTTRALAIALALVGALGSAAAAGKPATATYIVQLRDAPAASYRGGVAGLAATRVREGERLDADAPAVQAYRTHLTRQRAAALARAGSGVRLLHAYELSTNGFAARMTEAQARALRASGLARSVRLERTVRMNTVSTPTFLGLDAPGGPWSLKNGTLKGENVIIANIDSGVQPENPSFFDQVDAAGNPVASGGSPAYGPAPRRFKGTCQTGPGFPRSACNHKLIGARVFNAGFLASDAQPWFGTYYNSPRDESGHGSHTLATAGGNAQAAVRDSRGILLGTASGIAPRARLVAYKALFNVVVNGQIGGTGYESDILAAIEAAVADGVDVINYSVSGTLDSMVDSVELAFLNASNAGVFVAASAGNSGPDNFVQHPVPWLTTVAASTHDRNPYATLTLGNGATFSGASFNAQATAMLPLVAADAIAAPGASVANARYCAPNSLDATRAAGKMVLCDRGGNISRADKGNEVQRAGGAAMVLVNTPELNDPMYPDVQPVPTVSLPLEARDALRAYAAAGGPTGSIGARYQVPGVVAPVMAEFSSRGPNRADTSILKPDITAPGVSVIAAGAYTQRNQAEHDAINAGTLVPPAVAMTMSGTSMSSPHVAGLAALIKQMRPRWSPAMIKSALMTSAGTVRLADGSVDGDRIGYGAGHVSPAAALEQPLVYPIANADYVAFLCGGWFDPTSSDCTGVTPIKPEDLNMPSFAAEVVGQVTFTRTVRNVSDSTVTVRASAAVPGFAAEVKPASLSLAPGRSGRFQVTFSTNGPATGALASGALAWSDGTRSVTSPVQLRAVPIQAPFEMTSSAASGSLTWPVRYGFAGNTQTLWGGLKPSTRTAMTAPDFMATCTPVEVPAGTLLMRASVYSTEQNVDGAISFYLQDNTTLAAVYANVLDGELQISVPSLAQGSYSLCLFPFLGVGVDLQATVHTWLVTTADRNGGLSVSGLPQGPVQLGASYEAKATWSGLGTGERYLGVVTYGNNDQTLAGVTTLYVEPGAATASARRASAFTQALVRPQRPAAKPAAARR